MRVAFAGTPEFARTVLARVAAEPVEIVAVLTQPDRAAGRGLRPQPSPVKRHAVDRGIAVLQPQGLRLDGRHGEDAAACRRALEQARPDAIVVAAYGLILPPWLLALPRHGCLNVHASLLPRWRGAAPAQRAIEAGDDETGVVLMQMDEGLDTGAMLLVERTPIAATDTAATLTDRLAAIGGSIVAAGLRVLADGGTLSPTPQPEAGVTYAAKVTKAEAAIDWRLPAAAIERRLRAFDPFPGARAVLAGEPITCWRGDVRASGRSPGDVPGTVVAVDGDAVVVECGTDRLALVELQRPGGRRLSASDFLRGRPIAVGDRFDAAAAAPT